jgi:hypothetical protein
MAPKGTLGQIRLDLQIFAAPFDQLSPGSSVLIFL